MGSSYFVLGLALMVLGHGLHESGRDPHSRYIVASIFLAGVISFFSGFTIMAGEVIDSVLKVLYSIFN